MNKIMTYFIFVFNMEEIIEKITLFDNDINNFNYNDKFAYDLFIHKFTYSYIYDINYIRRFYKLFIIENKDKFLNIDLLNDSKEGILILKTDKIGFIGYFVKSDNNIIYIGDNPITIYANDINKIFSENFFENAKIRTETDHITDIEEIIKKDDIEELQNMLINDDHKDMHFNVNSIFNEMTLINLAELHGAIKCFKFLLINNYPQSYGITETCVIYGGNLEILHILENENMVDNYRLIKNSIRFHKNNIFDYIINKIDKIHIGSLFMHSILYYNYYVLFELLERFDEIILHNSNYTKLILFDNVIKDYIKDFIKENGNILIVSKIVK